METWKSIPGYEGIYEASSLGRIRSVPGKVTSNARYSERTWKSRIIKQKHPKSKNRQDERVSLWRDGEPKDHLVSRLVASAFHGVPKERMTVNHINGDWRDNRAENLEWVSLADNIRHGFETGLYSSCQKRMIIIGVDGEMKKFPSMAATDRFLGRSRGYTSLAISRGYRLKSTDGKIYYPSTKG